MDRHYPALERVFKTNQGSLKNSQSAEDTPQENKIPWMYHPDNQSSPPPDKTFWITDKSEILPANSLDELAGVAYKYLRDKSIGLGNDIDELRNLYINHPDGNGLYQQTGLRPDEIDIVTKPLINPNKLFRHLLDKGGWAAVDRNTIYCPTLSEIRQERRISRIIEGLARVYSLGYCKQQKFNVVISLTGHRYDNVPYTKLVNLTNPYSGADSDIGMHARKEDYSWTRRRGVDWNPLNEFAYNHGNDKSEEMKHRYYRMKDHDEHGTYIDPNRKKPAK